MPRRKRFRKLSQEPNITYFKPPAVPLRNLEEVEINFDEIEAMRFCDLENLDQREAAQKMEVSRPTLQRILSSARKKTAEALSQGKAIKLKGGEYLMPNSNLGRGQGRGRGVNRGNAQGGRGRMGGPLASGPGGVCICPSCGHEVPHAIGTPCMNEACPKCDTKMTRKA